VNARAAMFTLAAGILFGAGLAWSTMLRPEVVLAFLHVEDLGLLLVLGGAVVVTLVGYRLAPRLLGRPLAGGAFGAHPSALDARTIGGAAIFGVGWGLCGVCPGPAIAGLGAGNWPLLWAASGMLLGAWAQGRVAPGPVSGRGGAAPAPRPA
jgi:uncharacterized membrane protein YedE/YeeE